MIDVFGHKMFYGYVDLRGNPVKRDKSTYPYSYDPYVIWKGDHDKNDSAVYSDRLMQWDFTKFNRCRKEVWGDQGQLFFNSKKEDIEKFLSLYFNEDIKLTAIMEGANLASGYPYWIFYYRTNN
jgi:hypothetical protein